MLDSNKTTSAEWRIFKWIFLPLVAVLLLGALISQSVDFRKCKKTCIAKGYEFGNYTPSNRAGVGEKCTCERVYGKERSRIEINL